MALSLVSERDLLELMACTLLSPTPHAFMQVIKNGVTQTLHNQLFTLPLRASLHKQPCDVIPIVGVTMEKRCFDHVNGHSSFLWMNHTSGVQRCMSARKRMLTLRWLERFSIFPQE